MQLSIENYNIGMRGFGYKSNYVKHAFEKKINSKYSPAMVQDIYDFMQAENKNPVKIIINATKTNPKNSDYPIIFATFSNNDAIVVDSNCPSALDFLKKCASQSGYKKV